MSPVANSQETLQKLLHDARQLSLVLKDSTADINFLVEQIGSFADAFGAWYAQVPNGNLADANLSPEDLQRLAELGSLHEEILKEAERLLQDGRGDITALQARRKGLVAYVDRLPKTISMSGPKKG